MMKLLIHTVTLLLFSISASAQLAGKITDTKGDAIPFASVIIQGTTKGTTANEDGFYSLELSKGTSTVSFQSIGYQKTTRTVSNSGNQITLNIILQPAAIQLSEFVIHANAEDPAYAIMREAIKKRKYFRDQVKSSSSDVYIKGIQKIISAPKKIFGREIGTIGGSLDSNGQGIVYLSETISKYYTALPDKKKEELLMSKVSGNDNGFRFNRAEIFDFTFYDAHIDITRQTLSPLAGDAMLYYKFKLIGTIRDSAGYPINKIEVIPKRKEDPTWGGFIYIVDNQWNIAAIDLFLTGRSLQQPILDTLFLRQTHVLVEAPDVWRPTSQTVDFKIKILGVKIKGNFSGIFSNYNLHPNFAKDFFGAEVYSAKNDIIAKNDSAFNTVRPIPLTVEEKKDYVKKDSIKLVRETPAYKDSVDRVRNKFTFGNLFLGYNHRNSLRGLSWSISSPITTLELNPVQGYAINLPINFTKRLDKDGYKVFNIEPNLNYGFSEKILRASISSSYRLNGFNRATFSFSGGTKLEQFNESKPITDLVNEAEMAFYGKSYMRLYDKKFVKLGYKQELLNGFYIDANVEAAQRNNVNVNYQKSNVGADELYTNTPENINALPLNKANILKTELRLVYNFNQKFASYPNHKQIESDVNSPTISLTYQKTFAIQTDWADYDKIKFSIEQRAINLGLIGVSEINATFGTFLNSKNVTFADYQHFNGNQTIFGKANNYMSSFFLLPYYQYSTTGSYFEAHYQHLFNGFIFDKIPLLKKLGATEIIKVSYLNTPDLKNYTEYSFGLGRLGFGLFKIFRVDVATSLTDGKFSKPNFIVGIGL